MLKMKGSISLEDLDSATWQPLEPTSPCQRPRSVIQDWVGFGSVTTPWGNALPQTMALKLNKMQRKTGCFKCLYPFALEEVVRELLQEKSYHSIFVGKSRAEKRVNLY